MMADKMSPTATPAKEVLITRIFNAPPEVVFDAWTDAKHMKEWWGPTDFTNPVCEIDARPGGAIRIDMRGPAGTPYDAVFPMTGFFEEVVRPSRLVFTESAFFGDDESPGIEARTTVAFEPLDGKTKVTVRSVVLKAKPEHADALSGMEEGWGQSLDKLAAYLGRR
jgi:uncharacterized protein YndB with AHSA1/START domain